MRMQYSDDVAAFWPVLVLTSASFTGQTLLSTLEAPSTYFHFSPATAQSLLFQSGIYLSQIFFSEGPEPARDVRRQQNLNVRFGFSA